ncbi:MAG: glycosyltransferase [Candidatus Cloacimonetes bacterium]|nr:glycosyltransferase [Candidatus Cloacimonadota bacterium]
MNNLSIQVAKDGNPVPIIDGFQIHSLYHPEKEGKNIVEKFLQNIEDYNRPLLVLGIGFAYHILPLIDKFDHIWIAENNKELIELAKKQEFLQVVFKKCVFITEELDLTPIYKTPNYEIFYEIVLRSELRFEENFFNRVKQKITLTNKNFIPENNQIRVLVNSPIYGGSFTTAKYIESALKNLKINVRFVDNSSADSLLQKYLSDITKYSNLIDKLTDLLSDSLWNDVLDFQPHIVFFPAQSPFSDSLVTSLKKAEIVTVYWFVEDFRRFSYWQQVCNQFDYFFMIQKGEFEKILQRKCNSVWGWFPMAAENNTHRRVSVSNEDNKLFNADVSFMGAAYPNRINFFKQLILNIDRSVNFKIWGTGWSNQILPQEYIPLNDNRISIEQSNIIYQTTKININLHSAMNDNLFDIYGDFVNPRTFEIAACGGFQLVDDRESIRELFEPDKDIVVFSSLEEAIDKIKYYLTNESLRKKIANAGREKVLKFHTYDYRLKNMLSVILENSPKLIQKINNENQKIQDVLKLCQDNDLETFLNNIEPGLRLSYEKVINEVYKSSGSLKNYEAFLMLLDTFVTGD